MMRSLRARLTLAFALIAVVPLAIAMAVLAQRIRASVRTEAADRLATTATLLEARLEEANARTRERLALLAADPSLKRLVLVDPGQSSDAAEALAERRFLLGLDLLMVTDTSGRVIADAAAAPRADASAWPASAIAPVRGAGSAIVPAIGRLALVSLASVPVRYQGGVAALLVAGAALDSSRLADLARSSGIALRLRDGAGVVIADTRTSGAGTIDRDVALALGPPPHATLTAFASTAVADRAVAALGLATLALGGLGLVIAVVLAALASRQISRPIERLAGFSERIAAGAWDEPLALASVREIETLVGALDRMRRDLGAYRDRLRVTERHAAWSQMARQVAHEVANPLTPIAVSVADLKRSYDEQRPDFPEILDQASRTIADEVQSLRRLLRAFSELGRMPEPRPERCDLAALVADLGALYGGDVAAGRLALGAVPAELAIVTDGGLLRQALVNLIQNGLEADDVTRVAVHVARRPGAVEIAVSDDGAGIDAERRARIFTPGFTTKARGSGLGLTIVERIVHDLGGTIVLDPAAADGRGAAFRIHLPLTAQDSACPAC
ncbi:MAG: HAMP domain-containing protein [Candidatus Eisenbacteria bacterium]|nr:HAMP domain-containing protein [Candidatus Eisenbacteria bacterium]